MGGHAHARVSKVSAGRSSPYHLGWKRPPWQETRGPPPLRSGVRAPWAHTCITLISPEGQGGQRCGTSAAVSLPEHRREAGLHIHLGRLACPVVSLQLKKNQQQQQTQARWERCAEPFCKESSPGHPGMIYTIIHHRTVTRQKQMQQRGVMTQLDLDGPPYVEIFTTPHSLQPLFSELTIPPAR